MPTLFVQIQNANWDQEKAEAYINHLETNLRASDPAGLQLLLEHFGDDPVGGIALLKEAVKAVLNGAAAQSALANGATNLTVSKLIFKPNVSDTELIACLMDIIEAMAKATSTALKWKGNRVKSAEMSEDERRLSITKSKRTKETCCHRLAHRKDTLPLANDEVTR